MYVLGMYVQLLLKYFIIYAFLVANISVFVACRSVKHF